MKKTGQSCPHCNEGATVKRTNKASGALFVGCDQFPKCKYSKDWYPKTRRRISFWPTHMYLDIDEAYELGYGNEPEDADFY